MRRRVRCRGLGGAARRAGGGRSLFVLGAELDHFRCYDIRRQDRGRPVELAGQFRTIATRTVQAVRLCNPASANGSEVRRRPAHLVCYTLRFTPFTPLAAAVRNRFGSAELRVVKPRLLCLASRTAAVGSDDFAIAPSP